jgi:hypothetical protein
MSRAAAEEEEKFFKKLFTEFGSKWNTIDQHFISRFDIALRKS